ncbi:MAG: heat-shock protein [Micrococcales bacterium]|nr:MAG: heat-shock protein [Micrococcales bacterium]
MSFSWFDATESLDEDAPVFVISVAAQLAGMHPQTLRQYDRLGLVVPTRTGGGGRRYSARDVALLREVQRLSQNEGVNLAGIQRIMALEAEVAALRSRLAELSEHLDSALSAAQRSRRVFAAGPTGDVEAVRAGQRPRRGRTGSGEVVLWRPHRRSSWTG